MINPPPNHRPVSAHKPLKRTNSQLRSDSPAKTALYSGLASIPQVGLLLPFDTTKNCQQLTNRLFKQEFRSLASQGPRRLFQGLGISMSTVLFSRAMGLGFQHCYQDHLAHLGIPPHTNTIISSALAGFSKTFFCIPLDNVKNIVQTSGTLHTRPYSQPSSSLAVARQLYASQGIPGFYRGLPNALQKSTLGYSIWLPVRNWAEETVSIPTQNILKTARHFGIGALAGILTHLTIWPVDKIKTMRQTTDLLTKKSTVHALHHLIKDQGFRLYRGVWTQCGAAVFGSALFNTSWFLIQHYIKGPIEESS